MIKNGFISTIEHGAAVQVKSSSRSGTRSNQRTGSRVSIRTISPDDGKRQFGQAVAKKCLEHSFGCLIWAKYVG